MSGLNQISIMFPNGNEKIQGRQLEISWQKPYSPSFDNLKLKEIEVFFTDNYIDDQRTQWSRIARVPYSAEKFIWNFGDRFRSDSCRVAIRAVKSSGLMTKLFKSASNFSIYKSRARPPVVISPSRSIRYGGMIPIILDYKDIIDSSGGRDKIFIYYRSTKREIPLTPIRERVSVGTGPMEWDVSDLPNSDDYELVVFSSDDYGSRSNEVVVDSISIANEGYFITDSKPPEGFLVVNNGESYTRNTQVNVRLIVYDEATDVHGVYFSQLDSNVPYSEIHRSASQFYSENMITSIADEDGRGVLTAVIQDYGGNRSDPQNALFSSPYGLKNFRSLFDVNSQVNVVDVLSVPPSGGSGFGEIYFITSGEKMSLFQVFQSPAGSFAEVAELPMECSLVSYYAEVVYLAGVSSLKNFNLLKLNGGSVESIYVLSDVESEIVSMQEFDSYLYIGCLNGDIYRFDGFSLELNASVNGAPRDMYRVGYHLYILVKDTNSFYVHSGISITRLDVEANIIN